jgi:hypothetical protein
MSMQATFALRKINPRFEKFMRGARSRGALPAAVEA